MTDLRMQDKVPSGIILAKNPRSSSLDELKSYQDNTIYLNNGDEFQIRLFNPLREKIGVQIGMNGDLSQSLLVLNPGEDVTLDRFLDDKSKMLFETYVYDVDAYTPSENGSIDINFFKEKKVRRPRTTTKLKSNMRGMTNTGAIYGSSADDYSTLGNTAGVGTFTTSGINVNFSQTFESPGVPLVESDFSSIEGQSTNLDFVSDPVPEKKKETGRVEKGNESVQNFNEVNVEFETFSFYKISYNLKPTSERSSTITETKVRDYCPECGYRVRNTRWNFCPKCGDEI